MKKIGLILVLIFNSSVVYPSENFETVETQLSGKVSPAEGKEIGSKVNKAFDAINRREFETALLLVNEAISDFKKIFRPGIRQYSFQTDADFNDYISRNKDDFQRVDWSYREALHLKAFIYSANKDFENALYSIAEIEKIAPISAGSKIEKGYILTHVGKFEEAYKTYKEADILADSYKSQSIYKAASLRGMGFVLIELNKLEEAESMFLKSLEYDAQSEVALSELEYIKGLKERR